LPPRPGITYRAFCDASGGRGDAYVIAIGHQEGDRYVADVLRGHDAPLNPQATTHELAALVKEYCSEIVGDNYSAAWVETAWRSCGVPYKRSELPNSQLYLESLPLFMRGAVSIADHKRLVRELRLLERRTSRLGRDLVDHGRGGSDDHANALAGVLQALSKPQIAGPRIGHTGYGGGRITWQGEPRQLPSTPWADMTAHPILHRFPRLT
jgi:hypothetical protein